MRNLLGLITMAAGLTLGCIGPQTASADDGIVVSDGTTSLHLGGAYRHPWGYGYGWGVPVHPYPYYRPYWGPVWYPPAVLPAEELYGPKPIQRLMGIDHWFEPRRQPQVNIIVPRGDVGRAEGNANPIANNNRAVNVPDGNPVGFQPPANAVAGNAAPQVALRPISQQALALAWKYIGAGDAHFGVQRYVDANERYRKATNTTPQLADAWFRQSFALAAMGRYDVAVGMIKRGLSLAPDWPQSDFQLAELYDDNNVAKTAHLEALAKKAEEAPRQADLHFLLGVHLYFDGQRDRAQPFFERASQLTAGDRTHITAFLTQAGP